MLLSEYGKYGKLIEIAALVGDKLFLYQITAKGLIGPEKILDGVTGNPALIQRSNGEIHLVVPLLAGGLVHCWKNNDNPNPHKTIWSVPENFGSGIISAVSMIESDYGNLELVAKEGDKLVLYQMTAKGWNGPNNMEIMPTPNNPLPIDGVTGTPTLIQSAFGGLNHKNFELVVPREKIDQGTGLCYYWRNNDGPVMQTHDDPNQTWVGGWDFIPDTGKLKASANTMIRRNGTNQGLIVVSQVGSDYYDPHSVLLWPPFEHPIGLIVTPSLYDSSAQVYNWSKPVLIVVSFPPVGIFKGPMLPRAGIFQVPIGILQDADFWYNKGLALKALGKTTEADAAFAKAKEMGYKG